MAALVDSVIQRRAKTLPEHQSRWRTTGDFFREANVNEVQSQTKSSPGNKATDHYLSCI
jgi:hypothetical protein